MRILTGLAGVIVVIGWGLGGAMAQQANAPAAAPAAPRTAQRTVPKNAVEIVLANARSGATVTGLSVTSAAGKSVATLKKPLEPGQKITIRLPKNSGCTFTVDASFSDDAEFDQTDVNLCLDKNVRFTD